MFIDDIGDVLLLTNFKNDTPIHTALRTCSQHNTLEIVEHLVSRCQLKDTNIFTRRGEYGDTVLHIAVKNRMDTTMIASLVKINIGVLLLENSTHFGDGTNVVEMRQSQGDTPLHIAHIICSVEFMVCHSPFDRRGPNCVKKTELPRRPPTSRCIERQKVNIHHSQIAGKRQQYVTNKKLRGPT